MSSAVALGDARIVRPAKRLRGTILPPGDKSISHRAAIFGAIAQGTSTAENFLAGADCLSTLSMLRALGVETELEQGADGRERLTVHGVGLHGLREPDDVLDAGNSGTSMRLFLGLLAAQPGLAVLTGDASLRSRPMGRVITPLRLMGGELRGRDGDRLPPVVVSGRALHGVEYAMPVASAQLKSALLLAGLYASGETVVLEPDLSRDHSERMLAAMGAPVTRAGMAVRIGPRQTELTPQRLRIPGDISAAAFWLVAGAVHPDAEITLCGVGINPTRSGILEVLLAMGADIAIHEERMQGGEPVADLTVRSSHLRGTTVAGELIPRLIDEIPALALAGALAAGDTVVRDAQELRVKESDRISTTARELRRFGVDIDELPDGLVVHGGSRLQGAAAESGGDHRLAMTLAIAALLAGGESSVGEADAVAVSYPGFWTDLGRLAGEAAPA